MFGDKEVWYKRKSDSENIWEVTVRQYTSSSFEVESYSRFAVIGKIEEAMYKRGDNPREYKFIPEGCAW